jgi:hypothetical protein
MVSVNGKGKCTWIDGDDLDSWERGILCMSLLYIPFCGLVRLVDNTICSVNCFSSGSRSECDELIVKRGQRDG